MDRTRWEQGKVWYSYRRFGATSMWNIVTVEGHHVAKNVCRRPVVCRKTEISRFATVRHLFTYILKITHCHDDETLRNTQQSTLPAGKWGPANSEELEMFSFLGGVEKSRIGRKGGRGRERRGEEGSDRMGAWGEPGWGLLFFFLGGGWGWGVGVWWEWGRRGECGGGGGSGLWEEGGMGRWDRDVGEEGRSGPEARRRSKMPNWELEI